MVNLKSQAPTGTYRHSQTTIGTDYYLIEAKYGPGVLT